MHLSNKVTLLYVFYVNISCVIMNTMLTGQLFSFNNTGLMFDAETEKTKQRGVLYFSVVQQPVTTNTKSKTVISFIKTHTKCKQK